eukprot:m.59128 g.59128  ORF g.59128 m.59128 type:complete len:811 (-) comp22664_c0_seq1:87-2519(-)
MGNSLTTSPLDDLGPVGGMGEQLIDDDEATEDNGKDIGNQEYESLDYDINENESFRRQYLHVSPEKVKVNFKDASKNSRDRWIMHALIGIAVGCIAMFIDYFVSMISNAKYDVVRQMIEECDGQTNNVSTVNTKSGCLAKPWFVLTCFNVGFVLIATVLCGTFAPEAAGSGIPEIKCFLNGIKRKGWLNLKTGIVKVIGVLFSVSATMPVGKEGPMIHSGAIVGAGLPQLKSSQFGFDFGFDKFRNDHDKRDFVAAGAAAGVSAAFGAPIGGVLFSLEEGASHWYQSLTWRVFFTSIMSIFVLKIFKSGSETQSYSGKKIGWGRISSGSLVDFGNFDEVLLAKPIWGVVDIFIFILMAILGGLMGAAWNQAQKRLTQLRMRLKLTKYQRMAEACLVAAVNTALMFVAAMLLGTCQSIKESNGKFKTMGGINSYATDSTRKFFCSQPDVANVLPPDGVQEFAYNDLATLAFNPLEDVIKHLYHFDGFFTYGTLVIAFFLLAITSCWTYGTLIPSGLFVPALLTGAIYGRLVGELLNEYTSHDTYPGAYAVVGSAAFMGGVVRMTISLTVIMLEATNEMTFAIPIMITLMVAKWVGDRFDMGIYDIHIFLKKTPLMEWEIEEEMKRFQASDIMSKDVVTMHPVARVSDIVAMLSSCTHNGFPVVVDFSETPGAPKINGVMLRSDLITLLQNRIWGELRNESTDQPALAKTAFLKKYPQRTPIVDVSLPHVEEMDNLWMDITPYMNQSPYMLPPHAPISRCFRLFRILGLRHLIIVDEDHTVQGMITRKELINHRMHDLMHEFDHAFEHKTEH